MVGNANPTTAKSRPGEDFYRGCWSRGRFHPTYIIALPFRSFDLRRGGESRAGGDLYRARYSLACWSVTSGVEQKTGRETMRSFRRTRYSQGVCAT